MAKYLIRAKYTVEGLKGLLKEGGSARRAALEDVAKSMGARLEGFYFAFGDDDVYVIVDGGDNVGAAATSLMVGASGAAHTAVTVLLTPAEIDEATKRSISYRAPGR